jgi:hypothetical protein
MRTWRGFARFAYLLGACTALVSAPANAQLWVLASPDQPAAVERAELAYALGDGAAATWLSLRVKHGPVAVLAALADGARAETAIDGWFIALEDSASPSIVPPNGSDDCEALRPYVRTTWPRSQGVAASELRLETPQDVVEALAAEGLPAPPVFPAASSYVVWIWSETAEAFTTRTLRVVGGSKPLALSPSGAFPVSVSALSNGPLGFEDEVYKYTLPVTYVAGERPTADYRQRLDEVLNRGSAPLLEARATALLFDWSIYADVITVAPLVRSYAEQAGEELPDLDTRACREQLAALREAGAPLASACAEALDAGLALGLLDPTRATLQRFQLSGVDGLVPALMQEGGEASPPFMRAQTFDGSVCPTQPLPPIVSQPPVTREPGASPAPVVVEETVVIEEEPVELSCGGQPQPAPCDCDDDDDDDDEVDCSSDTSSSTSTASDEDCSSDTSSSSDTAGNEVDCSSDSSDSSSSDGCSGDTSSETGGYDGDTCTGSAAPRAETSAVQTSGPRRVRPARLKTSAWALGFAALVLPIRRRKRRPVAAG